MSISKRQRTKAAGEAAELLATRVHTVVPVRGAMHPLGAAAIGIAVLLAAAVVTTFFIGLIPMAILIQLLSPRQVVAVCDQGLAVLDRSWVTSSVTKVRSLHHASALVAERTAFAHVRHRLGNDAFWVPKGEVANLRPVTEVPGFSSM